MTNALTKLLEYADTHSTSDREKMLSTNGFKNIVGEKTVKTLAATEGYAIDNSTLVQEEVYNTVIEGREPYICMRNILPIVNTDTYSVRFVKGEAGTYAPKVPENGGIPIDVQTYTKQDITIDKWGTRPVITKELIEDSLFDIVQLELKKAGARMENALNREVLYKMFDGTHKFDTTHVATNDLSPSIVAQMITNVKKEGFMPDTLLVTPHAEGKLLANNNYMYASYAGTNDTIKTGKIPFVLGLGMHSCSATDKETTPVWGGTASTTADLSALVLSRNDAGVICMRRDLTVEDYADPIHDLIGMALTMRMGTDVLQTKAANGLYYKA